MCTIRNIFVYTVHGTQCNMYIHPDESMTCPSYVRCNIHNYEVDEKPISLLRAFRPSIDPFMHSLFITEARLCSTI